MHHAEELRPAPARSDPAAPIAFVDRAPRAARDGIGNAVPPPVMRRMLSFYELEERAPEEPLAKRLRA